MDLLHLFMPKEKHRNAWHDIISEFEQASEIAVPYALDFRQRDFDLFLHKTYDNHNNINLGSYVPATTYFLMDDTDSFIYGAVNIRHYLNEDLLIRGGHIGYGVRPSERRKGYATKMLSMALDKCREMGLEKVLVTCDKNNLGSASTILKNGGVLENEILEENGNIIQRYWITL